MRSPLLFGLSLSFGLLLGCSATGTSEDASGVSPEDASTLPVAADDRAVARVGDRTIRLSEVDERIAAVPNLHRTEYGGAVGRERMIQQMIEEEMLFRAAREDGLEADAEIQRQIEAFTRQLLVQSYLDREHERISSVGEAEARKFYEEHLDEYTTELSLSLRILVQEDESKAKRAAEILKEGSLSFADTAARFSSHPQVVGALGLIPQRVRRDRAIPWIGNHAVVHEAAFALENKGDFSDILSTPSGYVIVALEEIHEPRQRSFEEARRDIDTRLMRGKSEVGLPDLLTKLEQRFAVERYELPGHSAEELFAQAQSEPDPRERANLYQELVDRFPEHERALESRFMVGFIRSEELHDKEGAAAAFQAVIDAAPDSELAQSARWMLTSEEGEAPPFVDDGGAAAPEERAP